MNEFKEPSEFEAPDDLLDDLMHIVQNDETQHTDSSLKDTNNLATKSVWLFCAFQIGLKLKAFQTYQ